MRFRTMFCCMMLLAGCSGHRGSGASSNAAAAPNGGSGKGATSGGAAAKSGGSAGTFGGTGSTQTSCSTPGATRSCCGSGAQTCGGTVEFQLWGPCLDTKGAILICTDKCGSGEFGPNCDGGTYDSGHVCGDGEFGPNCTQTGPDSGLTCHAGELGPTCVPPPGNGPDGGVPSLCNDPNVNNEPDILMGYAPGNGQSVSKTGQIKVWVTDERPPFIAPGEQIDASTGAIAKPGDRTATAPDGYLLEPALYIAPATAENGGTPHFPQWIKGQYDNTVPVPKGPPVYQLSQSAPIDAPPPGVATQKFIGEDIWDVSALGLAAGTYTAEFLIHDGDRDRAVGCITIVVTP